MTENSSNVPVIQTDGLARHYIMGDEQVRALDGVDLTIERGEMVAIMGPSGSGKSTLMNLLGCLDTPTSGAYRLNGEHVGAASDDRLAILRNEAIGFVFQSYNLLPRITAAENVALPLHYGGGARGASRAAIAALERVGLGQRARHKPTEMSGGEQQRVSIARALVNSPSLVLADEPTGNLDTATSQEIMATLQELNEQDGITLIIVTHEADVANAARRIISIRDGRIVDDQRVEHVRESPAVTGTGAAT